MISTIIILVFIQLLTSVKSTYTCTSNCATCISGTCTACLSGYYLNFGNCQPCNDSNCATCDSSGSLCTACKISYGLRISDSVCIMCYSFLDSNCITGPGSAVCQYYARNAYGSCLACASIYRNCLKCDNSRCLQCNSGYVLNITVNCKNIVT